MTIMTVGTGPMNRDVATVPKMRLLARTIIVSLRIWSATDKTIVEMELTKKNVVVSMLL